MAHTTITISVDAYEALKRERREGESFSEEVLRLTGEKHKLSDLAGILSEEKADEWQKGVEKVRKKFRVREWR